MTTDESPHWSASWVWLLVLFTAAGFVETVFYGQLGAFIPLYLPRLGISPDQVATWTGAVAAAAGVIGIPFLPFWGALADRYARQPIIVRSFVVELLAALGMLLAGNIWVFVIGRSLTSLALGNSGLMMTTLAERTPRQRRGLAFTIMNAAPPIGVFVGPLLSGPIVDAWGFQALLVVDSILLLIVILVLTFGYRDAYRGTNRGPLLSMAVESVRIIGRSARLSLLFPALFLLFAGWMLAMTYAPLAIIALYQGEQPGTIVGLVLGTGGLAALILSPVIGMLADRFGHWRVLFAGALAAVILWPLPIFAANLLSFGVTLSAVNGLVSAIFALSFVVLSESTIREVRGRVLSFAFLPVNLGVMVGPAIGSLVTRHSVFAVFPTAALLTALGIGVLRLAARQPVDREAPQEENLT